MTQAVISGRVRRACSAALLALAALAPPARAAELRQIDAAIKKGRDYLFAHQAHGNWEAVQQPDIKTPAPYAVRSGQWGGMTAIATVSLLAAGVDAQDPHIKAAIAFLRSADIRGYYALGLRAQVWGLLPPEPWTKQAEFADLQLLERGVHTGPMAGPTAGLYGYTTAAPRTDADHSVSQFAVLGTWALAQAGVEVPSGYWQLVDSAWHRQQVASGGWTYQPVYKPLQQSAGRVVGVEPDLFAARPPTLSMAAAGVATLFITQEYLQIAPRCSGNIDDPAIDAGLRYLGTHLKESGQDQYYTLFGISRVGLASGYKYLGTTDWFQWGTDLLCREQARSGAWGRADDNPNVNAVPDTSFALLFLSRGRLPVMMNKLQYDVVADPNAKPTPGLWNQRPRDVANLSRWVGKQIESSLNWQVVSLGQSAQDLHEAPILYMAGGRAPKLSPEDTAKLRTYIEDGGLVLGHADCGSPDFTRGFKALGEQMFPADRFRPLDKGSPIYTNESFPQSRWTTKPAVDALSNGDRELMVLLPQGDPARQWQGQSFQSAKRDTFGQLMIDLFLYAVDKEGLRQRGETYLVARNANVADAAPVKVARLRYAGNCDPEPGGWRQLAARLHNDRVAELTVQPVDPGALDGSFALASLTVAAPEFHLSDAARASIRAYVRGGGTLLVDAAGGSSIYRTAAEAELAKLFPDAPHPLPVLSTDASVYNAAGPMMAATSVDYRRFQRNGNKHAPRLRGYTLGPRVAVFYSPEDVSAGLVGQPIDGIAGYLPADATKVVSDIIAYAAQVSGSK